ncbi:FAD-binding domain-containing protein [Flammeovirga sp. SJP92]|uniref:FAD-binding domain-containing protein n=1 Tax=Flammeovirga sp. SJP92 TaxID=1775430 RepID=UPI00078985D7|nr:FAD-binding domain-containing protein [Flammeovirga sp. SJP92]KXX69484.1 deoxyribodipyrimidine photolyase [Flammeovirga sp. SJP92]
MLTTFEFPTTYQEIKEIVRQYSPENYARSRNYIDGEVSYLSPYISRGVISTKYVVSQLVKNGHSLRKNEKFIQELAWRDYWQQIWIEKDIDQDLKHEQPKVEHRGIPSSIYNENTGINILNDHLIELRKQGYLHNHMRMYIAMLTCNVGKSHWKLPAQWMYYHLLDHDWASNALSWQWVAGANSNKKYFANQTNINKYTHTFQKGTYLDKSYEELEQMERPTVLQDVIEPDFKTNLPESSTVAIDPSLPTFIYNSYNLDPLWNKEIEGNRILLLEPSHFDQYPISDPVLEFIIELSKNIDGIQIFSGEFHELKKQLNGSSTYYKEHPTVRHYKGIEEERDWISNVKGYYPSFFKFWKYVKKEIFNNPNDEA